MLSKYVLKRSIIIALYPQVLDNGSTITAVVPPFTVLLIDLATIFIISTKHDFYSIAR